MVIKPDICFSLYFWLPVKHLVFIEQTMKIFTPRLKFVGPTAVSQKTLSG